MLKFSFAGPISITAAWQMPFRHFRKSLFLGHFLLIGHNNLEGGHTVPFEFWLKTSNNVLFHLVTY